MSQGYEDLAHEFPEYKAVFKELRSHDGHFSRLASDYHDTCKELHRIESGLETPDDPYVEALKLRRLHLKDQLYALLRARSLN